MRYGIALGSNLGDRLGFLREALRLLLLRVPGARLVAAAPAYETEPVDCPDGSGAFVNSVIEIECPLEPVALLEVLKGIEADLGRPSVHGRHAPRTIDLDILHCGDRVLESADLVLPHPRLARRRFVLQPLADLRPDFVPPGTGASVSELARRLDSSEPAPRLVSRDWAG